MKKVKLLSKITLLAVLLIGCSKETNDSQDKFSVEYLSHGENLAIARYDGTENSFILGYWTDDDQIKYEVRDVNFNIVKSDILEGRYNRIPPNTITMVNDSVIVGMGKYSYFKTKENLLITKSLDLLYNDYITINNPTLGRTPIFDSEFPDDLGTFFDSDDYIVFSAFRATCYFIRKSDFEVTSFKDYFGENFSSSNGGRAVGRDELGRIILSTKDGIKVYKNGEWLSFANGAFDLSYQKYLQFYTDSQNRLLAKTGNEIIVYDLIAKKKITQFKISLFSRILGEDPEGNILIFNRSSDVTDITKRIYKIRIAE